MRKEYRTKKGLFVAANGVSLEVQPNSLVALLGPSGSGPRDRHCCCCHPTSIRSCRVLFAAFVVH